MASILSNVALIGKHSEGFISELKKAGFTPVEFKSANQDTNDHQAIAISGSEHGLTDKATISKLLDAGKVLVAFEPGADYLQALHAATRTPIDLTATKPTVDRPLMVHKENGDTVVTLTPVIQAGIEVSNGKFRKVTKSEMYIGATAKELANTTDTPYDSAQVVERIKRAVDAVNKGPKDIPSVTGEVIGLDPGSDVSFYKKVVVRIPADYSIKTLAATVTGYFAATDDVNQIQVYHTEWQMTIYVYATDYIPLGQTADTYKGTIYTYIVHDGVHGRKSGSPARANVECSEETNIRAWQFYFVDILGYNLQDTSGLLTKVSHQPDDNIFDHNNNTFTYNISREQSMMLWKANETQKWQFDAKFQKPCAWNRFQMHHDLGNFNDAGYVLAYNDYYDVWSDPEFNEDHWYRTGVFDRHAEGRKGKVKTLPDDYVSLSGLTVFTSTVGKAPLHLEFDYVPRAYCLQNGAFPDYMVLTNDVVGLTVDDFVLDLTWDA